MAFKMFQVEDHMTFNVTGIISKERLNEVLSPLKRHQSIVFFPQLISNNLAFFYLSARVG